MQSLVFSIIVLDTEFIMCSFYRVRLSIIVKYTVLLLCTVHYTYVYMDGNPIQNLYFVSS